MAKGYKKVTSLVERQNGNSSFTASSGVTIRFKGISPLFLDTIRTSVEFPKPPTYTITTEAGVEEVHPHDPTTLQTPEERKLWNDYLLAYAEAESLQKDRIVKAVLTLGVEVDLPEDESWKAMHKFLGLKVPDDPIELRYYYVRNVVLGTADDLATVMERVMGATGVPEEALAEARASFRSAMEKANTTGEAEHSEV